MAGNSDEVKVILFITILTSMITNGTVIENLYVPDVVQSGSNDVILCCQVSSLVDDYSVHWLFNGNKIPSSQWDSLINFKISEAKPTSWGKIDAHVNPSIVKQSLLRFERITPDMSGNYTCKLNSMGAVAQQTKHMFVYSPENDFSLNIKQLNVHKTIDVRCTASGLFPRPEITMELDNSLVSKQVQRIWWKDSLYAAEGYARLRDVSEGKHEVTCRLYLPQADYTAIMKKFIHVGSEMCCGTHSTISNVVMLEFTIFALLINERTMFL